MNPLLIQIGVCLGIFSFAVPVEWNFTGIILCVIGIYAVWGGGRAASFGVDSPFFFPIVAFLAVTILTTTTSRDISKSLWLGVSLFPASFVFYLIAEYFVSVSAIRLLFIAYTTLIFALSSALLTTAWNNPNAKGPSIWISELSNPLLLVPNDTTLFVLFAPFSLALLYLSPRSAVGCFAAISLILSTITVVIYQNGVALISFLVMLGALLAVLNVRFVLSTIVIILLLGLMTDAVLGWPLIDKFVRFSQNLDPRLTLWLAAWAIFLDHPLLGYGPHTFGVVYGSYVQQLWFPEWLATDPRHTPWAHNLYLETLAEQGIFGILALGFLLYQALRTSWKVVQSTASTLRVFALAIFAGWICFSVASLFELTFKRLWVWVGFATLLGTTAGMWLLAKRGK